MRTFIREAREYTTLGIDELELFTQIFGFLLLEEVKVKKSIEIFRLGVFVENKYGGVDFNPADSVERIIIDKYELQILVATEHKYRKKNEMYFCLPHMRKCLGLRKRQVLRLLRVLVYAIAVDLKNTNNCTVKGLGKFINEKKIQRNFIRFMPNKIVKPRIKRMLTLAGFLKK
jgi:hypothetical protein